MTRHTTMRQQPAQPDAGGRTVRTGDPVTPVPEVHIRLADDVVTVTQCPAGIRVIIRDYDLPAGEGVGTRSALSVDEEGKPCIEFTFECGKPPA